MQLSSALVPLFDYPIAALLKDLPGQDSPEWDKHQHRQQAFAQQRATRSIVLRWLSNDWRPGQVPIVLQSANPGPLALAAEVFAERLKSHFGGTIAKLFLAELPVGAEIPPHRDLAEALTRSHRCHLPILTNRDTQMTIGDEAFHLQPGIAYEFDNTRRHGVRNAGETRRVHLICDILPDGAWALTDTRNSSAGPTKSAP
ncbi:MAG: aspartyl/asparaginyl beta-hydroxylase domain-containing protein [Sphingomonas bacterium]